MLKITSTEKKGKYFWNQNLEEALQMLKVKFPKVSKLELGLLVVIKTITSPQPPTPPQPQSKLSHQGKFCL